MIIETALNVVTIGIISSANKARALYPQQRGPGVVREELPEIPLFHL